MQTVNSMARLCRAKHATVPVDYVLGIGGYDVERVEEQVGLNASNGILDARILV